jgi:2-polyprenyl-3-methyl-5-hydroxy-6-metoxy-1,4-benzoquinol methylase
MIVLKNENNDVQLQIKDETTLKKCEIIKKFVGSRKRIAIFGCGVSKESLFLRKLGNYVIGIDKDKRIKKLAKKRNNEFILQDLEKEFKLKRPVDVIIAFEVIEHIRDHTIFMKNIRRNLKKGGVLILSTPSLSYWKNRISLLLGKNNGFISYEHCHPLTPTELKKSLEEHNFIIKKMIGIGRLGFLLSTRFPLLSLCGDFLVIAVKK